MDTNSQPVNAERVWVAGPTWLGVKSQVKAGGKAPNLGPGDDDGSIERRTTRVPTWLKVKSQVNAGHKAVDFGLGTDDSLPARPRPSWLRVKSEIKAGAKDLDFGTANEAEAPCAFPLMTLMPSVVRIEAAWIVAPRG